jgi:hypothetical protein
VSSNECLVSMFHARPKMPQSAPGVNFYKANNYTRDRAFNIYSREMIYPQAFNWRYRCNSPHVLMVISNYSDSSIQNTAEIIKMHVDPLKKTFRDMDWDGSYTALYDKTIVYIFKPGYSWEILEKHSSGRKTWSNRSGRYRFGCRVEIPHLKDQQRQQNSFERYPRFLWVMEGFMAHNPVAWPRNRIVIFEHDSSMGTREVELSIKRWCNEESLVLPNMENQVRNKGKSRRFHIITMKSIKSAQMIRTYLVSGKCVNYYKETWRVIDGDGDRPPGCSMVTRCTEKHMEYLMDNTKFPDRSAIHHLRPSQRNVAPSPRLSGQALLKQKPQEGTRPQSGVSMSAEPREMQSLNPSNKTAYYIVANSVDSPVTGYLQQVLREAFDVKDYVRFAKHWKKRWRFEVKLIQRRFIKNHTVPIAVRGG